MLFIVALVFFSAIFTTHCRINIWYECARYNMFLRFFVHFFNKDDVSIVVSGTFSVKFETLKSIWGFKYYSLLRYTKCDQKSEKMFVQNGYLHRSEEMQYICSDTIVDFWALVAEPAHLQPGRTSVVLWIWIGVLKKYFSCLCYCYLRWVETWSVLRALVTRLLRGSSPHVK